MQTPTKKEDDERDMQGYVHSVSPVENDRFHLTLQTKQKSHRVVCFTPTKRAAFAEKSPVKITNFSRSQKSGDIMIGHSATIEHIEPIELDFDCADLTTLNIQKLKQCASGTLVTIKGTLTNLYPQRKYKDASIREAALSDATGSIKLVLWETFVDQVEKGLTYNFTNLRLNTDKFDNFYLCTARTGSSIEKADPFKEQLNNYDVVGSAFVNNLIGEIMSVEGCQRYLCCSKCKKKINNSENLPTSGTINCNHCGSIQKIKACKRNMFIRFTLQDNQNKDHALTMFYEQIAELIENPFTFNNQDLTHKILELPLIKVITGHDKVVKHIQKDE